MRTMIARSSEVCIARPSPLPGLGALCLAAALMIAGSGCGGGSTKVEARTTTVGQELQDLEDARNKGLLTEDEYQRQREEIMNRK